MDDVRRLRLLADEVADLGSPVTSELARQVEGGDFAGALADDVEYLVHSISRELGSFAEVLRDAADEREQE